MRRARDVFDPSTEWARPQYGGELDRRRVQRELEKLAAREGADADDPVRTQMKKMWPLLTQKPAPMSFKTVFDMLMDLTSADLLLAECIK